MSTDGLVELSAQETGTAWLVLLTLTHPELDRPIRVTSDGVETLSQGNLFSPFPFEVTLPDDVEGRTPQAELRIAKHHSGNYRAAARVDIAAGADHPDRPLRGPGRDRARV